MTRMVDDDSWWGPPKDKATFVREKLASVGISLDEPASALAGASIKAPTITVSFDTSRRDEFIQPAPVGPFLISPTLAKMLGYRPPLHNSDQPEGDDGEGYEGMIHGSN